MALRSCGVFEGMRFSGSCARCAAYNGLCNRPTDKADLIKYIRCGEEAEPLSAGKDRMEPDKYFVKYASSCRFIGAVHVKLEYLFFR